MTTDSYELPPMPRAHVVHWSESQQELHYLTPDETREYALLAVKADRERKGRVLHSSDPCCPKCGHNRDKSSVSSVCHPDGRRSCQMCGATWTEIA